MINKKNTMRIIVRVCSLSNNTSLRAFKFPNQKTMILECLNSLFKSCSKAGKRIKISIVDDSGTEEFRNELKELLQKYNLNGEVIGINLKSNSGSIVFCLDLLNKAKEDLFFICEDDYLFVENAMPFILDAYDEKIIGTNQFGIFPQDYIYAYEKLFPSYIFTDKNCHWRSIVQTTGTFVITKKIFDKNKKLLYEFGKSAVDFKLMELWEKVPAISPIPSLACHLNYDTLSPHVNWQSVMTKPYPINKYPKEKINKDNVLKKVKRNIKIFYGNMFHKPLYMNFSNNHLESFKKIIEKSPFNKVSNHSTKKILEKFSETDR